MVLYIALTPFEDFGRKIAATMRHLIQIKEIVLSPGYHGRTINKFRRCAMAGSDFFITNITVVRRTVQALFGLFTLFAGYQFYRFYCWTLGQGEYVARPPAVEGFLPISALLSLKRLLLTGAFDPIHPAGLVILLAALTIAVVARKGFCGWICPVGFASHLAQWLGDRLRLLRPLPAWLAAVLGSLKYVLLGFFLYVILWRMDVATITAFLHTPYNLAADAKMLQFFLAPSTLTVAVLGGLLVLSLVVANFWCRFLCPYGALLGLLALGSPLRIRRDAATCIGCRQCDRHCPGGITVSRKAAVRSPECIGCLACVAVCPKKACLSVQGPAGRSVAAWLLPALTVAIFLGFWAVALVTDHWHSQMPAESFRRIYQIADQLGHPSY